MKATELAKLMLEATGGDTPAAIDALEDGEALLLLGVTDQSLVEDAHDILCTRLELSKRYKVLPRWVTDNA
jgi:hypothetical protein